MIETYKIFSRFADKKNLVKTNEELANLYINAGSEYDRSQAVSCIYIKNIGAIMNIASRHTFTQSPEKASIVLEEIVNSLSSYSGETKFITYLSTRLKNAFLWECTRTRKSRTPFEACVSIEESDEDSMPFQLVDPAQEKSLYTVEFFASIHKILKEELKCYRGNDRGDRLARRKIIIAGKIVDILSEDSSLGASQIAAVLGMFKKDKNGNYKRKQGYRVQPCKTRLGEVKEGENRETQWYLVNDAKHFLKDLIEENNLAKIL